MSGSTFGKLFSLTTFGESHGPAIGVVVQGCPPGLPLSEAILQVDLDRRKPGQSRYVSQRREPDQVQIVSGVFEGLTTGTPIMLLIPNEDAKPQDYAESARHFRPGHGDYTYFQKYGIRDYRGGGRASARETAARVAAGAIAKQWLRLKWGTEIRACVTQIGPVVAIGLDWAFVETNPLFCPDPLALPRMETCLVDIRKAGDSIGARVLVEATSVPVGLGEPVFDKLDAEIAKAMMSINAVKGVEIGDGFLCVTQKGSEHRDPMTPVGFQSNHAGGILAGISTGQSIQVQVAVKPPSSILLPVDSMNEAGEPIVVQTKGRHDPCVGPRAVPVVEAMLACVLMDFSLRMTDKSLIHRRCGYPCG